VPVEPIETEVVGPLRWAGTETAAVDAGSTDGAVSSGIRSVTEIIGEAAP
jgi:monoamine oxidase